MLPPISIMMEYILDEYSQAEIGEDHVNVNCVLSWRQCGADVWIDFRNGWQFNSLDGRGRPGARETVLAALRRNQRGKFAEAACGIAVGEKNGFNAGSEPS